MLSLGRLIHRSKLCLHARSFRSGGMSRPPKRPSREPENWLLKKADDKSEWWTVDGEMHEVGDNVPRRERYIVPRINFPSRRRKQLREQFMRRTRLVLKDSDHEIWCRRYMELYNELRENWERLYWDEGYSKKLAQDHANYDSSEDDEEDFNPYRRTPQRPEYMQQGDEIGNNGQGDTWEKVGLIRDRFEYDREKRMQENAFAPMTGEHRFGMDDSVSGNRPFNPQQYVSGSDDE